MIPEGISPVKRRFAAVLLGGLALVPGGLWAQQGAGRITSNINETQRATLAGTRSPRARPENDTGRVPAGMALEGITVVLKRTPEQESALQTLIAAQQDPASPLYHQWLTPEEFGARFGAAPSEISAVEAWLQQHGFAVERVSRSQDRIIFSGSVGQVESTLATELHYYTENGETHFAPALDLSIPAALEPVIESVTNLSTFRLKPRVRNAGPRAATEPEFTSGQTGSHFLTPGDVATIYDITPAYGGGYNGSGQTIAVVGQSAIVLSDVEHFQTAAGFTVKDPTLDLVPSSGTSTVVAGDESESDLDLEYTSTIASGATIRFVYTGNNSTNGVLDALKYAVDQKLAPVISMSYGTCETGLGSSNYQSLNGILAQAATQGQSVIVSAGDNGSPDCYGETGLSTAQQQAPAVDFPASSQYVTAMGGTEFPSADVASSNSTYWKPTTGNDMVNSALSYIPEQAWNDDAVVGGTVNLSSGGGGVSTFTSRPSWQTGVPGIPSGSFRLVPDVSLDSSPANAPYLFCSSDTSLGISGSCTNGFRDSTNKFLTAAGGTSFAAPIFAAMAAILNDRLGSSGQGVLSPVLYTLAGNSTTYGSAFHDTTIGGNQCDLGTTYCSAAGAADYAAGRGYDEATGLGSVDFYKLMSAWPGVANAPVSSKTTLALATNTPLTGATDAVTITVASASSSSTAKPTGTLTLAVDGTTVTNSLALSGGSAAYSFSSPILGSHPIAATYSGDSTYASSSSSVTVTVIAPPLAISQSVTTQANTAKSITLSGTPGQSGDTLTYTIVTNPAHGTLSGAPPNLTYTPASGYTGADSFTFDVSENGNASNTATVSITVTTAPPPPVAHGQSVSTSMNTAVGIALTGTPGTAGDTLTYAIAAGPAHGTLSGTPPSITYTPASGYTGADSFTFKVTESNGAQSATPGTVSITVSQPAPAPSKTTVSPATLTPLSGANDAVTITVAPASGTGATPTGTLSVSIDGVTKSSSLALTNGSASYTFSSTAAGTHTISATYSGNTVYASSSGSSTVTVSSAALLNSKTSLLAAKSSVDAGVADAITVTVSSGLSSSGATPTGTITVAVDGVTQPSALSLSSGLVVYNFSSSAAGLHSISATYSGDSSYASSSGSQSITVLGKSFTLSASNVTVAAGSSGSSTVTVTPQNGYTGTISWAVTSNPSLTNGCFSIANLVISSSAAATGALTVKTDSSACSSAGNSGAGPRGGLLAGFGLGAGRPGAPSSTNFGVTAGLMLAALLFFFRAGNSGKLAGAMAAICLFAVMGFAASGCTGTGLTSAAPSTPTPTNAAKGTYMVTIVGTDTSSASIKASATLTVTVD